MRLLVGLGNPGPQYRDTRHNVGFWVADEIARRWGFSGNWRERFDALTVRGTAAGEPFMLAKPLTFMNLSGFAVSKLAQYFQIEPTDTLVIVDEVALPLGRLRARRSGSAGGHNGLKSIVEQLGTDDFPRLRLGVGRGDERRDLGRSRDVDVRARRAGHDRGGGAARRRCRGDVCRRRYRTCDEHVQRSSG